MTQLAPDDVSESSTVGTARKVRIVAAGEVKPFQEAPFMPKRHAEWKLEDYRHELPHDAERFGVGLEDDRKLQRAKLIAGVLSEVALVGMLITSLQEPGRASTVLLAVVVAGLGLAIGVHVTRYRTDGQPRGWWDSHGVPSGGGVVVRGYARRWFCSLLRPSAVTRRRRYRRRPRWS